MKRFRDFLYLIEDRVDKLKDQYPEHHETIDRLSKLDSSPTKKYIGPLMRMHVSGGLDHSDEQIKNTIENFDRHGSKLDSPNFGDKRYRTLDDINTALRPHVENYENKVKKTEEAKSGGKIIYDNGNGLSVRRIDNESAACKYGSGTKWCVSSRDASVEDPEYPDSDRKVGRITKETDQHIYLKFDDHPVSLPFKKGQVEKLNAFEHYSEGGKNKMYIVHDQNNGRKFAYHEGEGGDITRDEKDDNIGTDNLVNMYPELSKIKELKDSVGGHHFITNQEEFNNEFNKTFNKNQEKLNILLGSKYLNKDHIDRLLSSENKFQTPVKILNSPLFNSDHMDEYIKQGGAHTLFVKKYHKITPEHIDRMIEQEPNMGQDLANLIARHPSVQYRHLKWMLTNPDKNTRLFEVAFKPWLHMDSDKIHEALNDKELPKEFRNLLMVNKNLTPEHITKALQNPEPETRSAFLQSKVSNEDHIRQGLQDQDQFVKQQAIKTAEERGIKI